MKQLVKVIAASLLTASSLTATAQKATEEPAKGKVILQVFSNFHTGFGSTNNDRGFDLDRSYLGYEHKLGNGLSVKGVLDVGQSSDVDDYHRIMYLKNAQVQWKTGRLTLSGGLISTTQFNAQEKFWGYRYIQKSFQDQYKFGSSADLGVSAAYQLTSWLSTDAIVVNGEGYKKVQKQDGLNYGLGVTVTPSSQWLIRLYGGLNEGCEETDKDMVNLAAMVGFRTERFRIGAEYNYLQHAKHQEDANQYGYSVYAAGSLSKVTELYARYDDLSSRHDWNEAKDESALLVGAQFRLGKYVKVAPNFRLNMPKADDKDNTTAAYVNVYFGF